MGHKKIKVTEPTSTAGRYFVGEHEGRRVSLLVGPRTLWRVEVDGTESKAHPFDVAVGLAAQWSGKSPSEIVERVGGAAPPDKSLLARIGVAR